MRNKVIGIFLLFCMVAPVAGMVGWLQMRKVTVRKAVKRSLIAGIDRSELVLLKFTEEMAVSELRWEHSREFEYRGEMYDVVETRQIGDTTCYYVWWDHEETKLNRQLASLALGTLGKDADHQDRKQRLHQFFRSLYFSAYGKPTFQALEDSEPCPTLFCEDHVSRSSKPPTPPPKLS